MVVTATNSNGLYFRLYISVMANGNMYVIYGEITKGNELRAGFEIELVD